jgi:hypothetical protein
MAMRCQPASFSRSRRTVIWKQTDTKQCRILWAVRDTQQRRELLFCLQPTTPGEGDHTPSPKSHLPSVQEEGQPQAVELVRHLRIEERQEATDIVHAVHLCRVASQPPQWAGAERGVASRPT